MSGVSTPHVLLGLLAAGPRHGYDLKRAYDERLPQAKPLAYGQVYATLGRLERDGLVTPAAQDQDAGPERTWYALTDDGRARLDDWLGAVEPPAPYVTSTLFSKVVVSLLTADADRARDYLTAQRAAHLQRMRELTEIKRTGGLVDALLADHGLFHLEADLRWIDLTQARLGMLAKEVRR